MKNIIEYYYGIPIDRIEKINNDYIIYSDINKYILSITYNKLETIKIIEILNNTNVLYHLLVLTKENESTIIWNDLEYMLLKIRTNNEETRPEDFYQIITYGNSNWADLWGKRIDYYISQINEIVEDNTINFTINYYLGLTEISIQYFNNIMEFYSKDSFIYSINHYTLMNGINNIDYYNPTKMCIDFNVRDIAEYIKYLFFEEILTKDEILNLVKKYSFNESQANLFLNRLIYPSYIFNLFDEYIEKHKISNKYLSYIKKSKEYESLLSNIYYVLSSKNKIIANIYFFKSQH